MFIDAFCVPHDDEVQIRFRRTRLRGTTRTVIIGVVCMCVWCGFPRCR